MVIPISILVVGIFYFIILYFLGMFSKDLAILLNTQITFPNDLNLSFIFLAFSGFFGTLYMMRFENPKRHRIFLIITIILLSFHLYFCVKSIIIWDLAQRKDAFIAFSMDFFISVFYLYLLIEDFIEVIKFLRREPFRGEEYARDRFDAR